MRKFRKYKGVLVAVSDQEILQAQSFLAMELICDQPAAAVTLAALQKVGAR